MVGSRAVTEWNDRNQHHRSTLSLNMKGLLQINVTKNSLSGALQYTCFYVDEISHGGSTINIVFILGNTQKHTYDLHS